MVFANAGGGRETQEIATAPFMRADPIAEAWLRVAAEGLRGAVQMMKVELKKFNKRFGIAKMAAKAYVGKDMCCEAELTLVMGR